MASVVFDSTTFANDTAGSNFLLVGRVSDSHGVPTARLSIEPLPQGNGEIAKVLGRNGADAVLYFDLLMSNANAASWINTARGKYDTVGTLTTPRLTYGSVILRDAQLAHTRTEITSGGSTLGRYQAIMVFRRLAS